MQSLTRELEMRHSHIGKSCKLHFGAVPMKVVRASRQYLYDHVGNEYLDCISNVSHVGHCHPHVVSQGQEQMAKLTTSYGFLNDGLSNYAKRLCETLPDKLDVCYFLNSGSEANDLAIRLARAYTKQEDVVCVDRSYHGNLSSLLDISPSTFHSLGSRKKDNVHVVACPDVYRGKYRAGVDTGDLGLRYANEVKQVIQTAHSKGRQIGAFVSESFLALCGVIDAPPSYLKRVYGMVREAGGLCIADEVSTGLGRSGDHYWAFQHYDVVPDIVTCGKPMGNGHPISVVITSSDIANSLVDFRSSYGGNPVACAMGLAVLDVIENEKLVSSAKFVGRALLEGFKDIKDKHPNIGDVRGRGMLVGVEMVTDRESRKPAKEVAELLSYKMKEEKIIIANSGPDYNIMTLTPPLCFTMENVQRLVETFDRCLADIENNANSLSQTANVVIETTGSTIPLEVISGTPQPDLLDILPKRARYDDVD